MSSAFRPRAVRSAAAFLLLVFPLVLVGCAGKGEVSGKVTFAGKPLQFGSVQFQSADGLVVPGKIEPDGTYKVSGVPTGTARISVNSVDEEGAIAFNKAVSAGSKNVDPTKPGKMPKGRLEDFNKIPGKFNEFSSSGLSYDVKSGQQVYDIELK